MILEGLVTTLDADGEVHLAPMGPTVDVSFDTLLLRPFPSSTTYQNLCRHGSGVFHVHDDVELLARAAVGRVVEQPRLLPAPEGCAGAILADACRWYAFRVRTIDDSQQRVHLTADVFERGRLRDFIGFNRAKHAVVEAAILATRLALLPPDEVRSEFDRLAVLVDKTGGPAEHRAWAFLEEYLREYTSTSAHAEQGSR